MPDGKLGILSIRGDVNGISLLEWVAAHPTVAEPNKHPRPRRRDEPASFTAATRPFGNSTMPSEGLTDA
jgi:hypothetical protein